MNSKIEKIKKDGKIKYYKIDVSEERRNGYKITTTSKEEISLDDAFVRFIVNSKKKLTDDLRECADFIKSEGKLNSLLGSTGFGQSTPLSWSIFYLHYPLLDYLLEIGADPSNENNNNIFDKIIYEGVSKTRIAMLERLIEKFNDKIEAPDPEDGQMPHLDYLAMLIEGEIYTDTSLDRMYQKLNKSIREKLVEKAPKAINIALRAGDVHLLSPEVKDMFLF